MRISSALSFPKYFCAFSDFSLAERKNISKNAIVALTTLTVILSSVGKPSHKWCKFEMLPSAFNNFNVFVNCRE